MRATVSSRAPVWSEFTVHINQDAQAKPTTRAEKALELIDSTRGAPAETRETARIPEPSYGELAQTLCTESTAATSSPQPVSEAC